jgi:hypothetical protein
MLSPAGDPPDARVARLEIASSIVSPDSFAKEMIMFEKTTTLADKLANSLSRRAFLGSVGRWAGAAVLAIEAC